VKSRSVGFFSDGLRLDGELHLPDDLTAGERRPALIICSGYQGLKAIHPARFARALVPDGYVCLAFDYRGFGNSDGKRGRLVPQEQVEDVRAAIGFLHTLPEVDPDAISLIGWALGGGVAIAAAADEPHVRAVVAINAIGDGERAVRFMHNDDSWRRLHDRIRSDRLRRATLGTSELVHPFDIVPLDTATRRYVDAELYQVPGFGTDVSLESAGHLLRVRPGAVVHRIAPRPLLLIHGEKNGLHPPGESAALYAEAQEPKRLILLNGRGHCEWAYDNDPTFKYVVRLIRDFLITHVGSASDADDRQRPAEV
jgi:uncharacterized protein